MSVVNRCDAFLAKHHEHVSSFVLSMLLILTLDLITPSILLLA